MPLRLCGLIITSGKRVRRFIANGCRDQIASFLRHHRPPASIASRLSTYRSVRPEIHPVPFFEYPIILFVEVNGMPFSCASEIATIELRKTDQFQGTRSATQALSLTQLHFNGLPLRRSPSSSEARPPSQPPNAWHHYTPSHRVRVARYPAESAGSLSASDGRCRG